MFVGVVYSCWKFGLIFIMCIFFKRKFFNFMAKTGDLFIQKNGKCKAVKIVNYAGVTVKGL